MGAAVAVIAIFLPGLLLVYGALPFWDRLRVKGHARGALDGVNAAVVGILAAALYQPVWTSAVLAPAGRGGCDRGVRRADRGTASGLARGPAFRRSRRAASSLRTNRLRAALLPRR